MKSKGRSRLVEWGKSLLIVLLAISALYLLGQTQLAGKIEDSVQGLFDRNTSSKQEKPISQTSSMKLNPMRLAVFQDGRRFGVQYDKTEADAAFSTLSTLLSEALSSAGVPEKISEVDWRNALCSTGIYVDFLYTLPMNILARQLGDGQENPALSGSARRICLAADGEDVSLFYKDETDGAYYASKTTLSRSFHLDAAVSDWVPNGALFAFEVPNMDILEPYTLLTETPQPAVCAAENPLLTDSTRVQELLTALTFTSQYEELDPVQGGQIVEGNDTLRLSEDGVITFHTIDDSDSRFILSEHDVRNTVAYVQTIVEATAGKWCGQADICLAKVEETAEKTIITFQYCINGIPVVQPGMGAAAQFSVASGVITDFSLRLRTYSQTGENSLVLPEVQATAAMEAMNKKGKELVLIYQDTGAELMHAVWTAF